MISREAAKNAKDAKKKNENGGNSFAPSRLRVHSIGGGVLMACLAESITRDDVEALGLAIAHWRRELAPAGDTTCVFRDSAFEDDVAKANMAAILEQHGVARVRSL